MSSISKQITILKTALEARTPADVDVLQGLLETHIGGDLMWRPVGDIPDNLGAINAASDARLALNERYTNAIDAVIELETRRSYGSDFGTAAGEMPNPRVAAQKLFGVPPEGPHKLSNAERQKIAERVNLRLLDSGDANKPTCSVLDQGIGLTPSMMPDTILSIYRGNKSNKPFLMGVFGWGGSNALGYADSTVFVCRREPSVLDGEADGVGITIVRKTFNAASQRVPAYFYAVDTTNNVVSLDVATVIGETFQHGVQVTHVAYDLGIRGAYINQYQFYSTALFEPIIPVYLSSQRPSDKTGQSRRTLIGVGGRLKAQDQDDPDDKVTYANTYTLDIGASEGSVTAHLWVVENNKSVPADSYVGADSAITVTLNGQRQDTQPREWFKRECKLPHLSKRAIVQIEADHLAAETKAETFSTTRERMRGNVGFEILSRLKAAVLADQQLLDLEAKLREEALSKTAEKASEKDLEKLRKAIGKLGGRMGEMDIEVDVPKKGGTTTPPGPPSIRDTNDEHMPDVPTELRFDRSALTVEQGGRRKRLMLLLNAKNGYLPTHESDLTITVEGPEGATRDVFPHVRAQLLGGRAEWLLSASDDADLGDYKLRATLKVGDDELSDSVSITVVSTRETKGETGGKKGATRKETRKQLVPIGPEVNWIKEEHWGDYDDYGPRRVGHVDVSNEKLDIYLNQDFDLLKAVLTNPALSERQIETRKSTYMVPVALGLYRITVIDGEEDNLTDDVEKALQQVVAESVLLATESVVLLSDEDD